MTGAEVSDTRAVIDAALASADPALLDAVGEYALVVPQGGSVTLIGEEPEGNLARPRRVSGTSKVLDVAAFQWLWAKYHTEDSEVYANRSERTVTAVLNGDSKAATDEAGWRDHRIVLHTELDPDWRDWYTASGGLMTQEDFAEFIEDHGSTIATPTAATMRELAESLEVTKKAEFEGSQNLGNGQRRLSYKETVTGRAGQKGALDIPTELTLALTPFVGLEGDPFAVRAFFRYRLDGDGHLKLGVKLDRPDDVLKLAFDRLLEQIGQAAGQPVLLGTPPAERVPSAFVRPTTTLLGGGGQGGYR